MDINKQLCAEFSETSVHIENIVTLIDGGNTIPFIARYRKEMTGSMDDQVLRELNDRLLYLRGLEKRAAEIENIHLLKTLNENCTNNSGLIGWETDEKGHPCLKTNDSREAASVFSGGNSVFLVCIIIMIVAVPIVTIIYADKQKKKVFYNKE